MTLQISLATLWRAWSPSLGTTGATKYRQIYKVVKPKSTSTNGKILLLYDCSNYIIVSGDIYCSARICSTCWACCTYILILEQGELLPPGHLVNLHRDSVLEGSDTGLRYLLRRSWTRAKRLQERCQNGLSLLPQEFSLCFFCWLVQQSKPCSSYRQWI